MPFRCTSSFPGHSRLITAVAQLENERKIATVSLDGGLKVWSVAEERCLIHFNSESRLFDVAFVDDCTILTVSVHKVHILRGTDRIQAELTTSITDNGSNFLSCCAVLDGTTAVVGDSEGNLFKVMWNRDEVFFLKRKYGAHGSSRIWDIFQYQGTFATCSSDGTAKLWNSASLLPIRTFHGHSDQVLSVTHNQSFLVTASGMTLGIYDVRTGHHLKTIRTHTKLVMSVRLVEDTNIVVSSSTDKTIALHQIPSGECVARYDVEMKVHSMALLGSGQIAVAGSTSPCEVKVFEIHELSNRVPTQSVTRDRSYDLDIVLRKMESLAYVNATLEAKLGACMSRISKLESLVERLSVAEEVTREEDLCCIELEPFRARDEVFRLPCMHVHHTKCVLPYLKRQNSPECPICRTAVQADIIDNLPVWKWQPPSSRTANRVFER